MVYDKPLGQFLISMHSWFTIAKRTGFKFKGVRSEFPQQLGARCFVGKIPINMILYCNMDLLLCVVKESENLRTVEKMEKLFFSQVDTQIQRNRQY